MKHRLTGVLACLALLAGLTGCSGMSTSPMERQSINGMVDRIRDAQMAYYKQYNQRPAGFTDIATLKPEVSATRVYLGSFGTFASQHPCEVHQKEILCDKTFEFYKQVRYEWKGGRIAVSAVPGKMSQPLDTVEQ